MFGTDPRTRTTTVAGGAVLLLLSAMALNRPDPDPAPPTAEAVVAECRRLYGELNPTFRTLPAQRFEVRKGDQLLRVSVSAADEWISVCRSGPMGVDGVSGTRMSDGPDDQLRLFSSKGSMLEQDLLLGHVPAGATGIEARLASGETVTGDHDGEVFAIWAPGGDVAGAQVTAVGPGAAVIVTTTAP